MNVSSLQKIQHDLKAALVGQEQVVDLSLAAMLAGGHLLLEGPPGVGKTSLARAIAEAFDVTFGRVQMTSDLLPSEIVGILRPTPDGKDFEFRKGPIFANFLLADELNRTSPKTQAALLEAMAEGTVTVDGKTYELPNPFFVVATQNPLEFHGVYPLAESQLDRFMLQVAVSLPDPRREHEIYTRGAAAPTVRKNSAKDLSVNTLRDAAAKIHIEDSVMQYALTLIQKTRENPEVSYGVSVRGGLQFLAAGRALALLRGRDFVTPTDLHDLAVPALAHRLRLEDGGWEIERKRRIIEEILASTEMPR